MALAIRSRLRAPSASSKQNMSHFAHVPANRRSTKIFLVDRLFFFRNLFFALVRHLLYF